MGCSSENDKTHKSTADFVSTVNLRLISWAGGKCRLLFIVTILLTGNVYECHRALHMVTTYPLVKVEVGERLGGNFSHAPVLVGVELLG